MCTERLQDSVLYARSHGAPTATKQPDTRRTTHMVYSSTDLSFRTASLSRTESRNSLRKNAPVIYDYFVFLICLPHQDYQKA